MRTAQPLRRRNRPGHSASITKTERSQSAGPQRKREAPKLRLKRYGRGCELAPRTPLLRSCGTEPSLQLPCHRPDGTNVRPKSWPARGILAPPGCPVRDLAGISTGGSLKPPFEVTDPALACRAAKASAYPPLLSRSRRDGGHGASAPLPTLLLLHAVLDGDHELEAGPDVVDGADLDVDEAVRERGLAYQGFRHILHNA